MSFARDSRTASLLAGLTMAAALVPLLFRQSPAAAGEGAPLVGVEGQRLEVPSGAGKVTALIFYSTECPISNVYSPTLNALVDAFPAERFTMIGLCVDPDKTNADLREHAGEYALKFPVARDRSLHLARKYGAEVTPEAVVLDADGKVRYRGRIDDQFAARQKRNLNSVTHELKDAITALLAGKPVEKTEVKAVGCPLPKIVEDEANNVTFTKDVAPILQRSCQECHRRGQVGPFALTTYSEASKRADDIAQVAGDRAMPPWKPDPHFGPGFKNDRSLTADEIATLEAWADSGAPEGDPGDMPPPLTFHDDWALGTPDLIVEPAEDFAIPAEGADIYRCFVIPTNLPADVSISAIEYRPGNRRVVHHVLSYIDTTGKARELDAADAGPGYQCFSGPGVDIHGDLGGWAPGNEPSRLPDGVGRIMPRGGDVVMQVHYHPSGKPETDRTRIGLYFAKKPIKQALHWSAAVNFGLAIPAGDPNFRSTCHWPVPVDCQALAVTPHMHRLGRDMTMTLTLPDGKTTVPLVKINAWDFGWQNTYYFREPIDLPKGSVLNVEAHFDNSAKNPSNPNNPPRPVKWGEATSDEMCIGFIGIVKKGQDLTQPGQTDDLREILKKQIEEFEKRQRDAEAQAAAP
jgi:hypothetical protein